MTSQVHFSIIANSISIHTPTQGVTWQIQRLHPQKSISIHTPTQGVTFRLPLYSSRFLYFNPHSHTGSDIIPCMFRTVFGISIHTPTQGVTCVLPCRSTVIIISIHTPTQGVTGNAFSFGVFYQYFNPHSHTGSDAYLALLSPNHKNFNPHSHTGSDSYLSRRDQPEWNFNPHSHTGSDPLHPFSLLRRSDFNPHSHTGSDEEVNALQKILDISIHTPTQGVTFTSI